MIQLIRPAFHFYDKGQIYLQTLTTNIRYKKFTDTFQVPRKAIAALGLVPTVLLAQPAAGTF